MQKIQIIGAGLCGSVLAIRLGQLGFDVDVFEKRSDMRLENADRGRSINLALSERGIRALELIGMESIVKSDGIPMQGRMIHPVSGEPSFQRYSGRDGECIYSISRSGLNIALLNKAESMPNVHLHFNAVCQSINFNEGSAVFKDEKTGELFITQNAPIFGTDGAGSAVRQSMSLQAAHLRFDYSQTFLQHGYKELLMQPAEDGSFRMEKNALHIWPRGSYMMIALPNLDGSYTMTLFLPFDGPYGFDALNDPEKVSVMFESVFPDSIQHLPNLTEEFFSNPTSVLGTVKCYPWSVGGTSLLMGDAAHAIVPFYGQGMNCAFEDVVALDRLLDGQTENINWKGIFQDFQKERKVNTDAIADLAIDNFIEMRDHTGNPVYQRKNKLETTLEQLFPDYFSKYSMVTFESDIPYSEAMRRGRAQNAYLMNLCSTIEDISTLDFQQVKKETLEAGRKHQG